MLPTNDWKKVCAASALLFVRLNAKLRSSFLNVGENGALQRWVLQTHVTSIELFALLLIEHGVSLAAAHSSDDTKSGLMATVAHRGLSSGHSTEDQVPPHAVPLTRAHE